MLASEQLVAPHAPVAPAESTDDWQPVAAIKHIAQGQLVDSFMSILPEDADGTVRGARRSTWRR